MHKWERKTRNIEGRPIKVKRETGDIEKVLLKTVKSVTGELKIHKGGRKTGGNDGPQM